MGEFDPWSVVSDMVCWWSFGGGGVIGGVIGGAIGGGGVIGFVLGGFVLGRWLGSCVDGNGRGGLGK
jgi:hypothetical protein